VLKQYSAHFSTSSPQNWTKLFFRTSSLNEAGFKFTSQFIILQKKRAKTSQGKIFSILALFLRAIF